MNLLLLRSENCDAIAIKIVVVDDAISHRALPTEKRQPQSREGERKHESVEGVEMGWPKPVRYRD